MWCHHSVERGNLAISIILPQIVSICGPASAQDDSKDAGSKEAEVFEKPPCLCHKWPLSQMRGSDRMVSRTGKRIEYFLSWRRSYTIWRLKASVPVNISWFISSFIAMRYVILTFLCSWSLSYTNAWPRECSRMPQDQSSFSQWSLEGLQSVESKI